MSELAGAARELLDAIEASEECRRSAELQAAMDRLAGLLDAEAAP